MVNVKIINVLQNKLKLEVWVGAQTYIKQLRVNYLVIQDDGTIENLFKVSSGSTDILK